MNEEQLPANEVRASFWDLVMILGGAIALIATGLIGLGLKAYNNALNPQRAEAVANNIIGYQIPGGSEGKFGIKLAGVKLALVNSKTSPPDVELFVMKTPLNKETNTDVYDNNSIGNISVERSSDQFKVKSSRTENINFCGQTVPVAIREGQQQLENRPSPVFTVEYSVTATVKNENITAIVQAYGKDAQSRARTVFKSIKCR